MYGGRVKLVDCSVGAGIAGCLASLFLLGDEASTSTVVPDAKSSANHLLSSRLLSPCLFVYGSVPLHGPQCTR